MRPGVERYALRDLLGEGACARVWSATDRRTGDAVALKVLHAAGASDPTLRRLLAEEVRAVARLDHPSIVRVFDQGVIQAGPDPRLPPGSPWLAMELLRGGCLEPRRGQLAWPQLRWFLLAILDALAHAHARGIIHRDLKPSNVLLDPSSGSIRLTDFGLAHQAGRNGAGRVICGTPGFMAPEQVNGDPRDLGPWTDLYALGATAWTLAAGRNPFVQDTVASTLAAQQRAVPRLPAGCDVPAGFEGWVAGLLNRSTSARPDRAADVARRLVSLGEIGLAEQATAEVRVLSGESSLLLPTLAPGRPPTRPAVDAGDEPTVRFGLSTTANMALATMECRRPGDEQGDDTLEGPETPTAQDWRQISRPPARTGLGLVELRTLPLVGRETERDLLWTRLQQTAATGRPHAVIVRGASGLGTGRLGGWLAERSHELGLANIVRARWTRAPRPESGLLPGLLGALGVLGRSPDEARRRLLARAREGDVRLTELRALRPLLELAETTTRVVPQGPALTGALRLIAGRRMAVVVLEDTQWAGGVLTAVERILESTATDLPALFVLLVRDDDLPHRPVERQGLRSLNRRENVDAVRLKPLAEADMRTLATHVLGLGHEAADLLCRSSAGVPGAAVDLVGTWAHGGHLRPDDAGFTLDGAALLPGRNALLDRLGAVLGTRPPADKRATELAALLGDPVEARSWVVACLHAGVRPTSGLLDALMAAGLAEVLQASPPRWRFRDEGLRRVLVERAEAAAGETLHACCARALSSEADHDPARVGLHWLAAGRPDDALAPLARGVEQAADLANIPAATALEARLIEAMDGAALAPGDPRLVDALCTRAHLAGRNRDVSASNAQLDAAEAAMGDAPEPLSRARVAVRRAQNLHNVGRLEEGAELARIELSRLPDSAPLPLRAHLWSLLGHSLVAQGQPGGEDLLLRALAALELEGPTRSLADLLRMLGTTAHRAGRVDEGETLLQRAIDTAEAAGALRETWNTQLAWADLCRQSGDLARATEFNRTVAERARATGDAVAPVAVRNLALLELLQGRPQAARRLAVEADAGGGVADGPAARACVRACIAAGCAASAEWDRFDREFGEVERLVHPIGEALPDVAAALGALLELIPARQIERCDRIAALLERRLPEVAATG